MRLSHIEVCNAVLLAGTVTGAAQMLNVSQPAVTKFLQSAENHMGFKLFTRERNRMIPTEEALALQPELARVFSQAQRLAEMSRSLARKGTGMLRIDCVPSLATTILPAVIKRFVSAYPDVACHLETHAFDNIVERLMIGKSDIGVAFFTSDNASISEKVVARGRAMCVAPVGTFSTNKADVLWSDLTTCSMIDIPASDLLGRLLPKASHIPATDMKGRLIVETNALALKLAEQGVGTAVIDSFTASAADKERVQIIPLKDPLPVPAYTRPRAPRFTVVSIKSAVTPAYDQHKSTRGNASMGSRNAAVTDRSLSAS